MINVNSQSQKSPIPINNSVQRQDSSKYVPGIYKKVAEAKERQFIEYMLEQMNKTVDQQKPDSSATAYYKSLMNSKRAEIIAKQDGGLGMQKVILDQIYPERLRNKITFDSFNQRRANALPHKTNIKKQVDTSDGIKAYRKEAEHE